MKITKADFNDIKELLKTSTGSKTNKISLIFQNVKNKDVGKIVSVNDLSKILSGYKGDDIRNQDYGKSFNIMEYIKSKNNNITGDSGSLKKSIESRLEDILAKNTGSSTVANGKIDRDFKQGKAGDCWLLGGIESVTQNPAALAQLNKQIKVDKNGNVKVTLKGVHKTYTITKEELRAAGKLSVGDMDVRAIEIAFQKYYKEKGKTIRGGMAADFYKIMFGSSSLVHVKSVSDKTLNELQNGTRIGSVGGLNNKNASAYDEYGNKVKLVDNHEYAVKSVSKDTVELVNPWDTSKTLTMSRKAFKGAFRDVSTIRMSAIA